MKALSLIFVSLLLGVVVSAQDFSGNFRTRGDKAFRDKNYYEAAYYYKKAAEGMNMVKKMAIPYAVTGRTNNKASQPDRAYISYMLAESYRLYENYIEAEGWYYNVINANYEPKYPLCRLWYGVCLRANQHFDEALIQLRQFAAGYRSDHKYIDIANKEIATCLFAKQSYKYPAMITVAKMKSGWNTDGSDYSIVKRDNNFWLTSSRLIKDDKKHLNRIYSATAADNYKPVMITFNADEKKDELEYGTPSFDPAGKRMYLTRWYKDGAKSVYGIYLSSWQNGEWSTPKKLNANINADGFKAIQPFVTLDGKRIFFVSNKPGGQGGDDIWVSDLDAEGQPINSANLGNVINTPADEQAPYYDAVNKRLVYSSKGFLGLGGFDFFESFEADNNGWSAPRNMGYPFNSAKDDLYYYPDNTTGSKFYISSDRESDCCLELFEMYSKRYTLTGIVVDCVNTKVLPGATVTLLDSLSKQTVKKETVTASGTYTFVIDTKRPYNLVIEKTGYFTKVIPVATLGQPNSDTLKSADICLQAFKVNKPIELKNILYDFGKTSLRPGSEVVLNELVKIMKDNPKVKVELASHTDGIGSIAYNLNLSQKRAQSCVNYIVSKGISSDRIFAKGYGKSRPIAPNTLPNGKDNPAGRQLNRRTEFTVLRAE